MGAITQKWAQNSENTSIHTLAIIIQGTLVSSEAARTSGRKGGRGRRKDIFM
jgi:hypothetical protein